MRAITEGREDFVRLELSALRAHFMIHRAQYEPARGEPEEGGLYQCWAVDDEGNPCQARIVDKTRLASHYVHTRGGTHGRQAQKHMSAAVERGMCVDRSRSSALVRMQATRCRLCEFTADEPQALRQRILCAHLA
eukprot:5798786-Pyramimonas_sp.AAC.1